MIYELEERTDSDELYKGFYKRPASDIHRVVMEIFEAGSAPKADPGSDTVRLAWARLSQAMEAANASSQHIMVAYSPVCATPHTSMTPTWAGRRSSITMLSVTYGYARVSKADDARNLETQLRIPDYHGIREDLIFTDGM